MPWNYDVFGGADVLITGGLGFIGSSLARRLVDLKANVTLVDSLIPEYGGNLFNIYDIRDRVTVDLTDVRDAAALVGTLGRPHAPQASELKEVLEVGLRSVFAGRRSGASTLPDLSR